MGTNYGRNISTATKIAVVARDAGVSRYPRCGRPLDRELPGGNVRALNGQIAHIRAASPGGPRYEDGLTAAYVNGERNLLVLCSDHHRVVDLHPEDYSAEVLESWRGTTYVSLPQRVVDRINNGVFGRFNRS